MNKEKLTEIRILREKIINQILNGAVEQEYDISSERKLMLDEFFEKTSNEVITKILTKIYERLTYPGDSTRWQKNKFKVSVLAIIFPDNSHSKLELSYLEEKYREKFEELNLDGIGIIDFDIVRNPYRKNDEFYKILYSSKDEYINHYNSNSYMLEIQFSLSNKKDKAKERIKQINN